MSGKGEGVRPWPQEVGGGAEQPKTPPLGKEMDEK